MLIMNNNDMTYSNHNTDDDFLLATPSGIPAHVRQEYLAYHDNFSDDELSDLKFEEQSRNLLTGNSTLAEKKHLIFLLGHIGTLESYNTLENYIAKADNELLDWAHMALAECRAKLSSKILDRETTLIATEAGGVGNQLRYYVVLSTLGSRSWFDDELQIVRDYLNSTAQKHESAIETAEFGNSYVLVTMLVPMDQAAGVVIEACINACNNPKPLLRFHYYTTNTTKPSQGKIEQYLHGLT